MPNEAGKPLGFFSQAPISKRIVVSFLIILGLLLLLAVSGFGSVFLSQDRLSAVQTAAKVMALVKDLRIEVVELRRLSREYTFTGQATDAEIVMATVANLKHLAVTAADQARPPQQAILFAIDRQLDTYQEQFSEAFNTRAQFDHARVMQMEPAGTRMVAIAQNIRTLLAGEDDQKPGVQHGQLVMQGEFLQELLANVRLASAEFAAGGSTMARERVLRGLAAIDAPITYLKQHLDGSPLRNSVRHLREAALDFSAAFTTIMALYDDIGRLRDRVLSDLDGRIVRQIEQVNKQVMAQMENLRTEAQGEADWALAITAGLSAAALLIGLWLSRAIASSIVRPLQSLIDAMRSLAEGDDCISIPEVNRGDQIGEMARALLIFRDTSRKVRTLTDELLDANAHLEERVAQRTQDLSETVEQLRQQERQLEEARWHAEALHADAVAADQAKTIFLATMSHELRTPLHSVIGHLELLRHTEVDNDQRDLVHSAHTAANTLLDLIGEVLDFTKIESGSIQLETTDLSPAELIDGLMRLFGPRADQEGLRLKAHIDPAVPQVITGDPLRLRQVIMNFLGNAMKFTSQGGVFLSLTAREVTAQHCWLRCEVVDTGTGFASDKADQLFEAFAQAEQSTTRRYGGTGLGLAISKRLVELMGGRIGCDGFPGLGATFWFEIPVSVVQPAPSLAQFHLDGLLVLLACREGLRDKAAGLLRAQGAQIETAFDPVDVVALFRVAADEGRIPAAVVVDEAFLSESEASVAIDGLAAEAPLLLVARSSEDGFRQQAHRLGFSAVLTDAALSNEADPAQILVAIAELAGRGRQTPRSSEAFHSIDQLAAPFQFLKTKAPILVIDDAPMNRTIAQRQLAKLGLSCEMAENGRIGLEMATRNDYSLILVDGNMPEMDGFEFTRSLRQWEQKQESRVPVVAMTANVLEGNDRQCAEAGMDDFLGKPVTLERLASVLRTWLMVPDGDDFDLALGEFPLKSERAEESEAPMPGKTASVPHLLPVLSPPDRPVAAAVPGVPDSGVPDSGVPDSGVPDSGVPWGHQKAQPAVSLQELGLILGDDDPVLIVDMLRLFLDTYPEMLDKIRHSLEQRHRSAVHVNAHACKGAARNAGALALGEAMAALEAAADSEETSWETLAGLLEQGDIAFAAVTAFVESLERGEIPSPPGSATPPLQNRASV